jgi:hypothetical protein
MFVSVAMIVDDVLMRSWLIFVKVIENVDVSTEIFLGFVWNDGLIDPIESTPPRGIRKCIHTRIQQLTWAQ